MDPTIDSERARKRIESVATTRRSFSFVAKASNATYSQNGLSAVCLPGCCSPLANFGKEGWPQPIVAKISQETLAEMIGTTRSRVSHFMNKFRKLGFIDYNGHLEITARF